MKEGCGSPPEEVLYCTCPVPADPGIDGPGTGESRRATAEAQRADTGRAAGRKTRSFGQKTGAPSRHMAAAARAHGGYRAT